MYPTRSALRARTERVRQARRQVALSHRRWRGSLTAAVTTPHGLAVGFALGFGIGWALGTPPGEEPRKVITLPALLGTVRALLLAK